MWSLSGEYSAMLTYTDEHLVFIRCTSVYMRHSDDITRPVQTVVYLQELER